MSMHGTRVVPMWVPPKHNAWHEQNAQQAYITTWPLYPASIPRVAVVEALQEICTVPARQLFLQIMHAQAQYIWYTTTPNRELESRELESRYWSLPNAKGYAAHMRMDGRCRYEQWDRHEIVVPAPLLWALLSTVWGLQVKLAAKSVWNMRVCSIQHAAWSNHKRIGSLPHYGLHKVLGPDFGVELRYVATTTWALTPQQRWWCETADVHCKGTTSIWGWGPSTYTLLCLARGEQARKWVETVLQAVERLHPDHA